MVTLFAPFPPRPPRTRDDRLAKVHDDEVYPLFAQRFADLLLATWKPRPGAQVLELGCRAGAVTAELLRRMGGEGRIVAVDPSQALIDRARTRVGKDNAGRRVFFRTYDPAAKLPFADETFDQVVANVALVDLTDPTLAVADMARLVRPGGELVLTAPLRGTWGEVLDLFEEVLLRLDRVEPRQALAAYRRAQPDPDRVTEALEDAGLVDVEQELARWELLFRSAREFFYAPVIEYGPLPKWKEIAGKGPAMHEVFFAMKEAIDTYYAGHTFAVTVFGARFTARKPPTPPPPEPASQPHVQPDSTDPTPS